MNHLQLTTALAGDDLQHVDPPVDAELHGLPKGILYQRALVVDVVEVKLVFAHGVTDVVASIGQ
jgi:hypothetical protein